MRLAEGLVQARRLGPVPVKGLAHLVEVFELVGAMPTRTRLQVAAAVQDQLRTLLWDDLVANLKGQCHEKLVFTELERLRFA